MTLDLKKTCLKVFFHVPSNHSPTVSFFVYALFLLSNSFLPVLGNACLGHKACQVILVRSLAELFAFLKKQKMHLHLQKTGQQSHDHHEMLLKKGQVAHAAVCC